jgi:hypothetical protein
MKEKKLSPFFIVTVNFLKIFDPLFYLKYLFKYIIL